MFIFWEPPLRESVPPGGTGSTEGTVDVRAAESYCRP